MKYITQLLSDNRAELNLERMITIAIAFVCGALLVYGVASALYEYYAPGMDGNIHSYLD